MTLKALNESIEHWERLRDGTAGEEEVEFLKKVREKIYGITDND